MSMAGVASFSPSAMRPQIFLSYRSIDDEPPPRNPDGRYVQQLYKELSYELRQLGAADAVLWMDRYKIYPGDAWNDKLLSALNKADLFLALLSRNYVGSDWCEKELSTMATRIQSFAEELREGRIFRADKNRVPDDKINDVLRGIQAVRFFEEDLSSPVGEVEFYYRGQVQDEKKYDAAVHQLAVAIYQRLEAIGVEMGRSADVAETCSRNGRTVFVAKPAWDTRAQYHSLVEELLRSGYSVVPDPNKPLAETGDEARATIVDGLAAAELSIHLLGERPGVRPDGLDADAVPFQLACAAAEALRRPSFCRLIWAPKTLPTLSGEVPDTAPREPLEVLARFGARLPSDQVDGDIAERFKEFIFQRLGHKGQQTVRTIYIHCTDGDRPFGLSAWKLLKEMGCNPVIRPSEGSPEERENAVAVLTRNAQRALLCWGNASQSAVLNEIGDGALARWRAQDPDNRSIVLLIGPPSSAPKSEAQETGLAPEIAQIIDATSGGDITSKLAALA